MALRNSPKTEQLMSSFWAGKWTGQKPILDLLMFTDLFRASVMLGTKPSYGQWSDERLAARMMQGDLAALDALYERHAAMVLGITLRVTGDRALAEEVLQETFWQAWRSVSMYSSQRGSFTGWLFRTARSLAIDAGRKVESVRDR
jgi:RNA polymerase sigma-70 factor (ECF subfamily)